jgi:hypothetical protein
MQAQGECLTIRGQRLAEYIRLLGEGCAEEGPLRQVIRQTLPPRAHVDTPEQVMRSWRFKKRDAFGVCTDLDAIEDLEHRSGEGSGIRGLAPQ